MICTTAFCCEHVRWILRYIIVLRPCYFQLFSYSFIILLLLCFLRECVRICLEPRSRKCSRFYYDCLPWLSISLLLLLLLLCSVLFCTLNVSQLVEHLLIFFEVMPTIGTEWNTTKCYNKIRFCSLQESSQTARGIRLGVKIFPAHVHSNSLAYQRKTKTQKNTRQTVHIEVANIAHTSWARWW